MKPDKNNQSLAKDAGRGVLFPTSCHGRWLPCLEILYREAVI